jgi:hypothetical protein
MAAVKMRCLYFDYFAAHGGIQLGLMFVINTVYFYCFYGWFGFVVSSFSLEALSEPLKA